MEKLGHTSWRRQTVAQVESAARSLTVDELVSLAMALECTVRYLFSPAALGERPDSDAPVVDLGMPDPASMSTFRAVLGFRPGLWTATGEFISPDQDEKDEEQQ